MQSLVDMVNLTPLMKQSRGSRKVMIAMIDGPVMTNHPHLVTENIIALPGRSAACKKARSTACTHGTFVAGVLLASRDSAAPAICPDCRLLVWPVFDEQPDRLGQTPTASCGELAEAIIECIDRGANILNLSLSLSRKCSNGENNLKRALDYAIEKSVIAVAAAGNEGMTGATAITQHPWVIPVAACDATGRPIGFTNLGHSIGKRGLMAPGDNVISLVPDGQKAMAGGTSIAAPFVTGTIALLWSIFPKAKAVEIRQWLLRWQDKRRIAVTPPLLDAGAALHAASAGYLQ